MNTQLKKIILEEIKKALNENKEFENDYSNSSKEEIQEIRLKTQKKLMHLLNKFFPGIFLASRTGYIELNINKMVEFDPEGRIRPVISILPIVKSLVYDDTPIWGDKFKTPSYAKKNIWKKQLMIQVRYTNNKKEYWKNTNTNTIHENNEYMDTSESGTDHFYSFDEFLKFIKNRLRYLKIIQEN